jgi:hypothetical protein
MVPSFNGSTSTVKVNTMPLLPDNITISWWLYRSSFLTSEKIAFCTQDSTQDISGSAGLFFAPDYTSNRMITFIGYTGSQSFHFWRLEYAQPSIGWHHYVWGIKRFDGVAPTQYLAVDGVAQTVVANSSLTITSAP